MSGLFTSLNLYIYAIPVVQVMVILIFSLQLSYAVCFRVPGDKRVPKQIFYSSLICGGVIWLTSLTVWIS